MALDPRLAVAGALAVLAVAAGCSRGDAGITMVTNQTSTSFVTLPPPSTTVAAPPADEDPDDDDAPSVDDSGPRGEELYTVQSGDYLLRIARQFDVTIEDIVAYNEWESVNHPLNPGDEVLIPPEEFDPDGTEPADSGAPVSSQGETGDLCPDGSESETYTIRAGDTKGRVANRFDVTVAELDAANAATQFYAGFVVGIEIVIPC